MRRLLSLVLLAAFGLPAVAPALAFGQDAETKLPACCRRHGAHHCMMSAEQLAAMELGRQFTVVHSKCPMFPAPAVAVHHQPVLFQQASLIFAEVLSHPAQFRQVEAWARVALEGARHKRGPPAVRLS